MSEKGRQPFSSHHGVRGPGTANRQQIPLEPALWVQRCGTPSLVLRSSKVGQAHARTRGNAQSSGTWFSQSQLPGGFPPSPADGSLGVSSGAVETSLPRGDALAVRRWPCPPASLVPQTLSGSESGRTPHLAGRRPAGESLSPRTQQPPPCCLHHGREGPVLGSPAQLRCFQISQGRHLSEAGYSN